MLSINAAAIIDGLDESDEVDYYAAIQEAINAGAWSVQGSYGRAMMDAIESGRCMLGHHESSDYYGNFIPNRYQVAAGTKGSRDFVVNRCGPDWARSMEAVA